MLISRATNGMSYKDVHFNSYAMLGVLARHKRTASYDHRSRYSSSAPLEADLMLLDNRVPWSYVRKSDGSLSLRKERIYHQNRRNF